LKPRAPPPIQIQNPKIFDREVHLNTFNNPKKKKEGKRKRGRERNYRENVQAIGACFTLDWISTRGQNEASGIHHGGRVGNAGLGDGESGRNGHGAGIRAHAASDGDGDECAGMLV
jgi:hypothetical protein